MISSITLGFNQRATRTEVRRHNPPAGVRVHGSKATGVPVRTRFDSIQLLWPPSGESNPLKTRSVCRADALKKWTADGRKEATPRLCR
jgi:hypothetical protein